MGDRGCSSEALALLQRARSVPASADFEAAIAATERAVAESGPPAAGSCRPLEGPT